MSVVELKIGARNFQIACENGQETQLHKLAEIISSKFENLSKQLRTSNESLLFLMTCLMLQDELNEATKKIEELSQQISNNKHEFFAKQEEEMSGAINTIANYLEAIADKIESRKVA
ncbi:MAG: cell division protein ZapA [Rickettsiales bacterium]|nr:cell division protein ZapA [Rickettsiales bacterium]